MPEMHIVSMPMLRADSQTVKSSKQPGVRPTFTGGLFEDSDRLLKLSPDYLVLTEMRARLVSHLSSVQLDRLLAADTEQQNSIRAGFLLVSMFPDRVARISKPRKGEDLREAHKAQTGYLRAEQLGLIECLEKDPEFLLKFQLTRAGQALYDFCRHLKIMTEKEISEGVFGGYTEDLRLLMQRLGPMGFAIEVLKRFPAYEQ
jgi:hypothetical protein